MALIKANQRFFDVQDEPLQARLPIGGYEDIPSVSLKLAVNNLESIVFKATAYAQSASEISTLPGYGLTQDESAAICLYTMKWKLNDQSLSTQLNNALRSKDRSELVPYLPYLQLFSSALSKLRSVKKTIWRGAKANLSEEYPRGKTVIWWGFSSCVGTLDEIQSDKFLGKTGIRTIFEIECKSSKSIIAHSHNHDIDEVLLLPSIQFMVMDQTHSADGLCLIRLKEIDTLTERTERMERIERPEQKISSAPPSTLLRGNTNFSGTQRSKLSYSSPPSSLNMSIMQTKSASKPKKQYENKVLKELINEQRKEQSIRLSKQFFNYDDMEIIADELVWNKSWTVMYLWENYMNERHMTIFVRGLKTNSTVIRLSLDGNLLGDDGAAVLASALKTNTYLQSIYLNTNRIGDEGAEELSQMLYLNRTLTDLDLSSNTIGDRGAAALSNALKVNKYLRRLCLKENKITKVGAEYIGEMLTVNKTLTDLQLSCNAISNDGVIHIVQALEHNNTLEFLDISRTKINADSMHNIKQMLKVNSALKCLHVNNNHLGDSALTTMIPALRQNKTLRTLDLSMNDLTEESANKLACLLHEKEGTLKTLIVNHNPLGDQGVAAIASALITNTTLVKLMVENVDMTTDGVLELATMLKFNEELRYLSLSGNQIDGVGMKLLSDALERNQGLEHLYLNNCELQDKCVPLIIKMMEHSKTLKSMELVKNRFTENGKRVIKEAMSQGTTCSIYLDFTFH